MTLFGLTGGKNIGLSIGLVSSRLPSLWMAFTLALIVDALRVSSVSDLTNTGRQTGCPIYSLWLVWILAGLSCQL